MTHRTLSRDFHHLKQKRNSMVFDDCIVRAGAVSEPSPRVIATYWDGKVPLVIADRNA